MPRRSQPGVLHTQPEKQEVQFGILSPGKCWGIPQGDGRKAWDPRSASPVRNSGFLSVWKETQGQSQPMLLSSFQCSAGTNPQAAAHPAFLARGSFQQLYNMSAKRKQEEKEKQSYEVKPKKIKIAGSYGVAMAAGEGNSLFSDSATEFLIKPHKFYSKTFPLNCSLLFA